MSEQVERWVIRTDGGCLIEYVPPGLWMPRIYSSKKQAQEYIEEHNIDGNPSPFHKDDYARIVLKRGNNE